MLDYRKMMHLYERGASKNNLATIFGCKWETVDRAITRINEMWGDCDSISSDLTNDQIRRLIIRPTRERDEDYLWPDFSLLSKKDLKKMNHVLWDKYVAEALEQGKKAYQQSKFNALLDGYRVSQDISYPQSHDPGLECQVDWTGDHGHYMDPDTGEWIDVHVIVISMPYSGYFFSEGFLDEKMESFLKGHEDAFRFFGGVPAITIPDNCATATDRKTGLINTRYAEFLDFYGSLPKPTRVKAPKEKPGVEGGVKNAYQRIYNALRNCVFYSIDDLNEAIMEQLEAYNNAPFKDKPEWTRRKAFEELEKDRMLPLPPVSYEVRETVSAVVGKDSYARCSIDGYYYSVPCQYKKTKVTIGVGKRDVAIYSDTGDRIATHKLGFDPFNKYVTVPEHLESFLSRYQEESPNYFIAMASRAGEGTRKVIENIFETTKYPETVYKNCRSILGLGKRYGYANLEKACTSALSKYGTSPYSYIGYTKLKPLVVHNFKMDQKAKNAGVDAECDAINMDIYEF